jgi:threonine dehydrogenase-like Zn-dependent dehydrogenase
VKVPEGPPDERFLFLSDVLPTAWQAVVYADVPEGGTVAVFGLGPIGQTCCRVARHRGAGRVIGIDLVTERLAMAARYGVEIVDARDGGVPGRVRELTDGRGADSVIDAVGMESEGNLLARALATAKLKPDIYRALSWSFRSLRRGGTISIVGVYVGVVPGLPIGELFDRQFTIRMGQANVRRWVDDILPVVTDDADPLGTESFATHRVPLDEAPHAYEIFQKKKDGAFKVVFQP